MTRRTRLVAAAVAVLATAACGVGPAGAPGDDAGGTGADATPSTSEDPPVVTIAEAATRTGERVVVRGWLVEDAGTLVLAGMLAESYPPQPGGDVLVVRGADPGDDVPMEQAGDVRWSAGQVLVTGTVRDGALEVESVAAATPGRDAG